MYRKEKISKVEEHMATMKSLQKRKKILVNTYTTYKAQYKKTQEVIQELTNRVSFSY